MKQKMMDHLRYSWPVYLLIPMILLMLWSAVFDQLDNPAPNEKLYISFIGSGFDAAGLQSDMESLFADTKIEEVFADSAILEDTNLNSVLYTRSQGEFDAVIISESIVFEGMADTYCEPLDREQVRALYGDVSFYEENGEAYGIRLDGDVFRNYYSGKEKCWLFIAPVTKNAGILNGGNEEDDALLRMISFLIGGAA